MMNRRQSCRGRAWDVPTKLVDTAPSAQAVMVRDVLNGNCTLHALKNCSTHHLEGLLLKVLSLSPGENSKGKKPKWWPDDVLPFTEIDQLRYQVKHVIMSWHSALAEILESCVLFYSDHLPASTKMALSRGLALSSPAEPKRRCVVDLSKDMQPVVLLRDVLLHSKYPVLEKDDFMGFLKLQKCNDAGDDHRAVPVSVDANCRYSMRIPFSSTYGRKILDSERYVLRDRVYERKRDWTDTYLRNDNVTDTDTTSAVVRYNVTYRKKKGCDHLYSFPRRQQRQSKNAIEEFRQNFCRPVKVSLPRMNLQPYLMKRRLTVSIDKRETDKFYMKTYASSLTV